MRMYEDHGKLIRKLDVASLILISMIITCNIFIDTDTDNTVSANVHRSVNYV